MSVMPAPMPAAIVMAQPVAMAQPGMVMAQPGMVMAQPGMAMAQPGMVMAQPGMVVSQPGMVMAPVMQPMMVQSRLAPLQEAQGFYVRQKVDWFEEITGFEKTNKYCIHVAPPGARSYGEDEIRQLPEAFMAIEESECCQRQFCTPNHALKIRVVDQYKRNVLLMDRPFSCTQNCTCFCAGCICLPNVMSVSMYDDAEQMLSLGKITQSFRQCSCIAECLDITDAVGNHIFTLTSAPCQFGPNPCCIRYEFIIFADKACKERVGVLANIFPGCNFKAYLSKADNLEIAWTAALSAEHKALLLGCSFLIDFMKFEKANNDQNNQGTQVF